MDNKDDKICSSKACDFYSTIFTDDPFLNSLSTEELDEYVEMIILAEEINSGAQSCTDIDR